jgi:hypothetical protein
VALRVLGTLLVSWVQVVLLLFEVLLVQQVQVAGRVFEAKIQPVAAVELAPVSVFLAVAEELGFQLPLALALEFLLVVVLLAQELRVPPQSLFQWGLLQIPVLFPKPSLCPRLALHAVLHSR